MFVLYSGWSEICPTVRPASDSEESSILKEAKELGKVMDLNIVRLKFTAFLQDSNGGFTRALKPVVSNPIYDSSESTRLKLSHPLNTWTLPVLFRPAADWLTEGGAGVLKEAACMWSVFVFTDSDIPAGRSSADSRLFRLWGGGHLSCQELNNNFLTSFFSLNIWCLQSLSCLVCVWSTLAGC